MHTYPAHSGFWLMMLIHFYYHYILVYAHYFANASIIDKFQITPRMGDEG